MAKEQNAGASLVRHAWFGLSAVIVLVGGLVAWAALTDVAGAVIANGTIAVEGGSKRVQHQEGGIVREILARDEDVVDAGQVLIRLDGTAIAANLKVVDTQLSDALALRARLVAESTDAAEMTPPDVALAGDAERFESAFKAQDILRRTRAATQDGIAARVSEQIAQLEVQIEGLEAQQVAIGQQLTILAAEEIQIDALLADGLVEASRASVIKRELAKLRGESGRLIAEIASARAAIAERRLQVVQVVDEFQTQVLEELQAVEQKIAELQQQQIAAEDRLARLEVRAPQSGIVHQSIVHTVGGVVAPGETLMMVVPQASQLEVLAQVSPLDVDKLTVGQLVVVRLSGFDARTTPELDAVVGGVSPDLSHDPNTGVGFYVVKIRIPDNELGRLSPNQRLVPGMPAEAFIQTGDRTVLSYLIHPLSEQINHAFREAD